ncbi:MAG: CNNM domain-containing protein [Methylococcales bacterium]
MNDIPLGVLFSILALLLFLSAFFSASETGLMTLNRYRLQHLVKKKHGGAIKAYRLLQRPDRLLGLILLGNNFVNILASSLATIIAMRYWGEAGIAVAASGLTLVVLIFSEVAPKTLAAIKPEAIAFPAAYIYIPLLKLFYPVVWLVNLIANLCLKLFGVNAGSVQNNALGKEELRTIVAEADCLMPPRYHKMMLSIMDLESATVEDIMTPRNDIVGIDIDGSLEDIIKQIQNSTHTRLPVFKKTIDRVIGFLNLRTLLTLIHQVDFDKQAIIDSLLKPVFIPESTPLHTQMHNFKVEQGRIGLVVDEYGDVQGLVTLDDLLQEIVGELITDESSVKQHGDGSITVDAGVTIREFNRITHSSLPTEGPKTINGLIVEYMETIPDSGTSVNLHGYHLEIIERDGNTVKQVRFHPKHS